MAQLVLPCSAVIMTKSLSVISIPPSQCCVLKQDFLSSLLCKALHVEFKGRPLSSLHYDQSLKN